MNERHLEKRILGIDPMYRGFGYVVFEGPDLLIDWGVRRVTGEKNLASISAFSQLIRRYRPDDFAIEDVNAKSCDRGQRVRTLIVALEDHARESGLAVRRVSSAAVKKAFLAKSARNKHQIAQFIAAHFPELATYIPPERKPWMSESVNMAIFDAAAFALVTFEPSWMCEYE